MPRSTPGSCEGFDVRRTGTKANICASTIFGTQSFCHPCLVECSSMNTERNVLISFNAPLLRCEQVKQQQNVRHPLEFRNLLRTWLWIFTNEVAGVGFSFTAEAIFITSGFLCKPWSIRRSAEGGFLFSAQDSYTRLVVFLQTFGEEALAAKWQMRLFVSKVFASKGARKCLCWHSALRRIAFKAKTKHSRVIKRSWNEKFPDERNLSNKVTTSDVFPSTLSPAERILFHKIFYFLAVLLCSGKQAQRESISRGEKGWNIHLRTSVIIDDFFFYLERVHDASKHSAAVHDTRC